MNCQKWENRKINMNLLLSIHPEHVDKILSGEKSWEYRKSIFQKDKDDIDRVYIYSTSSVKRIVASFEIGRILKNEPEEIWNKTKKESGTNKKDFIDYFDGHKIGYGIEITDLKELEEPVNPYEEIEDFHAPQSYMYVNKSPED